jgi:uncharacterized membrane-anchored protein YhcB (DUF1043 family)
LLGFNSVQNPKLMEAYKILQRMTFSKNVNQVVIRAVRVRLERMLENKEAQYKKWQEDIKHKLNKTRQRDIERHFQKTIQAYKIIIFDLTPYYERVGDPPAFVVSKTKKT